MNSIRTTVRKINGDYVVSVYVNGLRRCELTEVSRDLRTALDAADSVKNALLVSASILENSRRAAHRR